MNLLKDVVSFFLGLVNQLIAVLDWHPVLADCLLEGWAWGLEGWNCRWDLLDQSEIVPARHPAGLRTLVYVGLLV